MKTIMKSFIVGTLLLIANIGIAGWIYTTFKGLFNCINNFSGWLAIGAFILLLLALGVIVFFLIFQGALVLSLANENTKLKEKVNELESKTLQ